MEKTTIKITDLLLELQETKIKAQREQIFNKLDIKKYVDYDVKCGVIKEVLETICLSTGEFKSNAHLRYVTFNVMVASLYSLIETDQDGLTTSEIYDLLKESGIMNYILAVANEDGDITELQLLWTMMYDDMLQEYKSIEAIVGRQVNRFATIITVGLDKLANTMSELNVDAVNKVAETASKTFNKFKK